MSLRTNTPWGFKRLFDFYAALWIGELEDSIFYVTNRLYTKWKFPIDIKKAYITVGHNTLLPSKKWNLIFVENFVDSGFVKNM